MSTFCRFTLTSVGMLPEPPVLPPVLPVPPVVSPVVPASPVVPPVLSAVVPEPASLAVAGAVSSCAVLQAASIVADATKATNIQDLVILLPPESY